MSELSSRVEVTPSVEASSSNRGFDPDRRIAEQSVDGEHLSIRHEAHKIDPDARVGGSAVAFKGLTHVESIADIQKAGTCWAESIENMVQLMHGDTRGKYNGLSEHIIEKVAADPQKWNATEFPYEENELDRWNIPPYNYAAMLKEFGVEAKTTRFSHEVLQNALMENRPVILGGDVKYMNEKYNQRGGHALVAVSWEPDSKKYVLLDSNFKEVYKVSPDVLEKFVKGAFMDKVSNLLWGNMTVAQTPAKWPSWNTYVDGKWRVFVNGLEVSNQFQDFNNFANKSNPNNASSVGKLA